MYKVVIEMSFQTSYWKKWKQSKTCFSPKMFAYSVVGTLILQGVQRVGNYGFILKEIILREEDETLHRQRQRTLEKRESIVKEGFI